MPKIVDHDAHSQDLARRAAEYFSHHGYAGSSMRKIAAHLGLSKSALYHYFPTKEALFLACTHQVMGTFASLAIAPDATEAQKLAQLTDLLRPSFAREMALIFDYLRGKSAEEIAAAQERLDAELRPTLIFLGDRITRLLVACRSESQVHFDRGAIARALDRQAIPKAQIEEIGDALNALLGPDAGPAAREFRPKSASTGRAQSRLTRRARG